MQMQHSLEVQCDGLIGPTHNYAGLSIGNLASQFHAGETAHPKKAALQGLEKMRFVHGLGCEQIILPPPLRPNLNLLQQLGIAMGAHDLTTTEQHLIHSAWSASSMWAANAATASPAPDTEDGALHLSAANLVSTLHRTQEAQEHVETLRHVFGNVATIHPPLPACLSLMDEGAANHMRLCPAHGQPGLELFVYGRDASTTDTPSRYPARQTRQASECIAHRHRLPPERCIFARQHPDAIDAGVFHNDVIAMSNEHVLIYHEYTFADEQSVLDAIHARADFPITTIRFSDNELPLQDAVASYLFNSQLLSLEKDRMALIAPIECQQNAAAAIAVERLIVNHNPIHEVHYLDVRESMHNGGGPACLRLRVVLETGLLEQIPSAYRFSEERYETLRRFITDHYPETLTPDQLYDPVCAQAMHHVYHQLMTHFQHT